ncbi:MAG: DNRLRE domain-containing protein, partial [Oscillospiraceae bacterium]|nr:DNRLRE domain-containing protein [Oscillospiraceae bacterium]
MQTTKKIFKISLCVIMSVLIGFLYMVQVYGSTLNQTTGTEANSENNDALILFEDKTKRDETTKHFKLDDGSYMAVMYDYPVHFEDADGKWEDYDNSLQTVDIEDEDAEIISTPDNAATTDNTEYKTKSSDFETRISKKSKENNMFKLKADEYKISWGYEGVQKKTAQIVENNQLLIGNERFTVLEDTSQEVLYSDIYNHVDLQVFATTKGIKENLLLKNSWAQKEFVVNYKINGLNAAQKDTKTIELKNADGEVVYTIAAPYMTDANGETSDGVTLAIESQKNKKLSVKISVDEAWVNAWGRAFPVAVDPDVTIMQSNTNTGIVTASTMQPNPDEIPFLTPNSAIFKFPNSVFDLLVRIQQLPGLKTGDVLTGAKLNFNRYTETASGLTINVHESSDEWSQDTICWNTAHPANGTPLYDTTTGVIDYAVDDKDEESLLTWDVTKLAKKWYNQDPDDSYSMVLSKNETSDGMILVHTGYYGNAAISPTFVVTYRSFQGTESNLTYHTHASAYNGEGSVSDYTGNLVLTQNLFEGTGEKMPVDIKMTYNGFDYDTVFQYGTKAEKGWQYSFNKFVAEAPLAMQQEGYRYMYNDEDGTEHYFKLRENATNIWEDEDGLGYVIIPATSSTPVTLDGKSYSDGFYMETPMGITYKFSTPAPVASWGGSTLPNSGIGRIITETDGTGNQITYTYNSEKLSTITDGAGRVYTISYAAASVAGHSYISKIVAPDGKEIEFSRFSSTSGTGFDDRLNRINYPGGIYIGFYYHDDGRLSVAYQAGNSGVEYLYTNGKVTKICEFDSHGNNAGNYIDILYGSDNTTTYTDRYGRSETYTFNNKGETISVLNPNGYISNAEQSNALLITSGAESYTKNYISNSSTPTTSLYNTSHGTIGSTQSTGGTRTIDTSTELVDYEKKQYLGSSSVKINSPNSAAYYTYSMRQINDISALKGKAATFSAYVKTSNVVDAGRTTGISGVYLKIAARDANGTEIALYNSSYTLFGSENWQRMSVTYPEVPENAVQLRIYLQMRDAYGTAWFDCMQLEEGDCANDYNALESGNNFSSSVWQGNSGSATINGASGQEKQVYQTVDVNKSNVAFVLSGSAEMDSVPLTDDTRKAGIKLNIVYEDDEDDDTEDEEEHYQTFNECTGVDQSVALTAYPKYPSRVVDYVEYAFVYDNNANTMVLNDASLCFGDYATDEEFLSRFDSEPETSEPQATTEPTTLAPVEPYQGNFEETENGIKSSYYGTVLTDSSGTEYVESIDLSQPYIKTQTEYDATGNYVIAESDERGNTTEYDIDADNGQTNSIELPDGSVENYTYDDAGRLTEVAANVSGIGNIENEYTYGGNNQLSEINHNGTRYSFSYNSFRNQTGASVGSQIISNNTYEANNGNLTSTSYGNGQSFSYVYDDLDRIVQINTTNNGTSQIFAKYFYNKKGLPSKVIDYSAGRTEIHFYDVWNELRQSVSYSNTGIDYVYSKHYEELGDVVEKATISGITRTITPQIHENLPRLYLFDGGWSSTIDKDELDRIDTIATRFGGSPTIDVFTTEYEYAPASSAYGANAETNLVSSLVQKKANTVLADYDYEYDINGNLTKVFEDGVETIRYEYYKNNILKAQNDMRTHKRVLYQYDVGGNIIYTDEYTIGNNWVADT